MTWKEPAGSSGGAVPTTTAQPSSLRRWVAAGLFLSGFLAGGMGFAAYSPLVIPQPPAAPGVVAVRIAARDGALDAIATMQAGGSPDESRATSTPVVVNAAIAERSANQMGSKDAPVTFTEFSDFQ